jgi:hypothetical protein
MSVLYAGQFKVQEWIEPLISTSLIGTDHVSNDDSSAMATMTPSSLVQVVSIGRPKLYRPHPILTRRSTMPLSSKMPSTTTTEHLESAVTNDFHSTDNITSGLVRSTSFNHVPQIPKSSDDESATIPTSLLVSDGTTTVLAVLSSQTRSNLSILATDNSLNSYQNNTITRGCVLKISNWRIETLASAIQAEEDNVIKGLKGGKKSSVANDDDAVDSIGGDKDSSIDLSDAQGSGSDFQCKETGAISISSMDYRNDPLLRDHQALLHHKYYVGHSQVNLPPEKVVVLHILGPIEIMGGHGLSAVGRPTYIMETIDVLRMIDESTGNRIQAKILENQSNNIRLVAMKRGIDTMNDDTTSSVASRNINNVNDTATVVTPAFHRRTVSSGLDRPHNITRDASGDILPLGDVKQLFNSPKRTKLNAIWEAFAAATSTSSATNVSLNTAQNKILHGTRQTLFEVGSSISNDSNDDSSSNTDFPIGMIDGSANPTELKRLFGNIIGKDKVEHTSGNTNLEDSEGVDRFATQVVEEVMSDEYSHSDVSCNDEDNDSYLGIDNMLVSQDTTYVQPKRPIEIAIAVAKDRFHNDMNTQKPLVRQQKHLRIKPVIMKPNPQSEELGSDEEDDRSDIDDSDIPQPDEDLLDTQPIHPVADQGNVIDDDVSINDDDDDNMLPDVIACGHGFGNVIKHQPEDDIHEFHDAVSNEEDLPNADDEVSYTPVETLDEIEVRFNESCDDIRLDDALLHTQAEVLPLSHQDVTPIVYSDLPLSKSYEQSGDTIEVTFDRWMRVALDGVNSQYETTSTCDGPEYSLCGESLRKYLCNP